jgi:hypothetical protein
MVFWDARSAWFAVQLGFRVRFPVSVLFPFFSSSLRIIDAVFGAKDIRLSAGDDQLFSQHHPLSYPSDGVGSLRRSQGVLSTDRLHTVSLSTKQLAFETRTQRRRRQTSPDGSRKAGHDSQHLLVALATRRNGDGKCEMLSGNCASEIRYDRDRYGKEARAFGVKGAGSWFLDDFFFSSNA